MRRRTITRWPATLPSWLVWACWESLDHPRQATVEDDPSYTAERGADGTVTQLAWRPKRERAAMRDMTDLERRAIEAYGQCYTPPYTFDRRLRRDLMARAEGDGRISDKQARWLWFYVRKHRRQIGDAVVVREAERQVKKTDKEIPCQTST